MFASNGLKENTRSRREERERERKGREERKRRKKRESRGVSNETRRNAANPLDVSIKTPADSAAVSSSSRFTRILTWKNSHDLEGSYVRRGVEWIRVETGPRLSYVRRALEAHPPLIGSRTITRACNVNTDIHKSRKFRGGRPVVIPGANWKF